MKTPARIVIIVVALALIGVLVYTAVSDRIFYFNQQLTPDTVVYVEGDGFSFPFYYYSNTATAVSIFHRLGQVENGLVPVQIEVRPKDRFLVQKMQLEISPIEPSTALVLENGSSRIEYEYQRTDIGTSVILDFPELDRYDPAAISFTLWLDMTALDASTPDKLTMEISLTVYENSIFKLVKYDGWTAVQIDISSAS